MTTTPSSLHDFIDRPTPYAVFDAAAAVAAYHDLVKALPAEVWYAVKAGPPVPALLSELSRSGANFDVASVGEVQLCLDAGIQPHQLSYGNPIRTPQEAHQAADMGVRTWTADTAVAVRQIADVAPGARVVIRLAHDGDGADWPLSYRFGCSPGEALELARLADTQGLEVAGLAWHVGSQQRNVHAWDQPLEAAAALWHTLARDGIDLQLLNLGGGLPGPGYRYPARSLPTYAREITAAVDLYFPHSRPHLVVEPGRSLVAAAGAAVVTVKAVVPRTNGQTFVFIDGGIFNLGLIEAVDGVIEYRIEALGHPLDAPMMPVTITGPTCDSFDIIGVRSNSAPYQLPTDLVPGDRLAIFDVGAYSTSYASQAFNGYPPAPLVLLT